MMTQVMVPVQGLLAVLAAWFVKEQVAPKLVVQPVVAEKVEPKGWFGNEMSPAVAWELFNEM